MLGFYLVVYLENLSVSTFWLIQFLFICPMEKNKLGFNLLRAQIAPEDKWDKIYNWVNNSARVIVIFVELIVIVSFGVRVVIDRQARDLEEVLKANKLRLDNLSETEQGIRDLQDETKSYKIIWDSSTSLAEYVEEVYDYNPNLFSVLSVSIDNDGFLSIGGTASRSDIGDLEVKMKASDSFSQVQLATFKPDGEGSDTLGSFQIEARISSHTRQTIGPPIQTQQNPNGGNTEVFTDS